MNLSKKVLVDIIRKTIKEEYRIKKVLLEGKKSITKPAELTDMFGDKFPRQIRKEKGKHMFVAYKLENLGTKKTDDASLAKAMSRSKEKINQAVKAAEKDLKKKYKKVIEAKNLIITTKAKGNHVIAYIKAEADD